MGIGLTFLMLIYKLFLGGSKRLLTFRLLLPEYGLYGVNLMSSWSELECLSTLCKLQVLFSCRYLVVFLSLVTNLCAFPWSLTLYMYSLVFGQKLKGTLRKFTQSFFFFFLHTFFLLDNLSHKSQLTRPPQILIYICLFISMGLPGSRCNLLSLL